MLDEFHRSLMRELDYRQEAQNLATLGENLKDFQRIVVPAPVADYSSERVLTMDYVRGTKITKLSPLARLDLDGGALAEELFRAYLKQILVDGFFHADPHPGNVFVTDDGQIALLDLGMVARLSGDLQDKLIKLILAMSEGRGEEVANIGLQLGEKTDRFDEREFRKRVAELVVRHQGASLAQIEVGALVIEETQISADCGIRLPAELTMLGKTLLNLDHVARTLDPEFDPNAAIQRNASDIMRQRVWKDFTPSSVMSGLIEAKEFVEQLPGRTNRILDLLASNDLRVKVDAIDEVALISGLQKIANRITLGLILAALIVGASVLMQVETPFRLFGYPGLAIICFLLAAGGGVALMLVILASDVRAPR
jgi:ubiquinone biosynthesis protein